MDAGEKREELIADAIARHLSDVESTGFSHTKNEDGVDIDRLMLVGGEKAFYFEIKERTNSLNGYSLTMFPFAKIVEARRLSEENGVPVRFYLLFTDALTVHTFDPGIEYKKGGQPFYPKYRPNQRDKPRQIPVEISVESLEIVRVVRDKLP